MGLNIRVEREDGRPPRFHLAGSIDEHAKLNEVLAAIKEDARLDLSKIERINSVGLIAWLKAMRELTAAHAISVELISYSLTTYANQLLDLFGSARVHSCMAPYYCPSCKANLEVRVSVEEVRASASEPPAKPCPQCRAPMDFDEMDEFFAFLRGQG